jgi:hypothetical protein
MALWLLHRAEVGRLQDAVLLRHQQVPLRGLGRKLSDVAGLFDRLRFRGIRIHATSVGPMTRMHIGIMGTMAQMSLSDLRDKTRRGQPGRARAGRIPGGPAFGYDGGRRGACPSWSTRSAASRSPCALA